MNAKTAQFRERESRSRKQRRSEEFVADLVWELEEEKRGNSVPTLLTLVNPLCHAFLLSLFIQVTSFFFKK